MSDPQIPPHWPKDEPFPWPYWERTCPGCGRYSNKFHIGSDSFTCAYCGWEGRFVDFAGSLPVPPGQGEAA